LDSAVLAASEARARSVHPIYVSAGLAWEPEELAALDRLLAAGPFRQCKPVALLTFTARDLYPPTHWALRGEPPAFDTPDEDVYLTGRNVMLLSKAAIYCAQQKIARIAIGPLAGNPFPDATPQFFETMARALSLGLAHPTDIAAPFASMHKSDVIRLGVELGVPLELTLSCMNPRSGAHCGQCSKCRERRDAFIDAGVTDPTAYATPPIR
jgi:7-cyano-7-deazaguanine synthase